MRNSLPIDLNKLTLLERGVDIERSLILLDPTALLRSQDTTLLRVGISASLNFHHEELRAVDKNDCELISASPRDIASQLTGVIDQCNRTLQSRDQDI